MRLEVTSLLETSLSKGTDSNNPTEGDAKPFFGNIPEDGGFGGFNEGGTEESETKKGWQGWSTN